MASICVVSIGECVLMIDLVPIIEGDVSSSVIFGRVTSPLRHCSSWSCACDLDGTDAAHAMLRSAACWPRDTIHTRRSDSLYGWFVPVARHVMLNFSRLGRWAIAVSASDNDGLDNQLQRVQ
jgi:hypothetical protein